MRMSDKRTPYDGKPYYCADCNAGLNEFYACEWPTCKLESEAKAKARQAEKIAEKLYEKLTK